MGLTFGKPTPGWFEGMTFWLDINRQGWTIDGTNEINSGLPVAYDRVQNLRVNFNGGSAPIYYGSDRYYNFNTGYYMSVDNGYEKVPMDGPCTLVMVLYTGDVTTRRTVFEKAGTVTNSYRQEIACTWETGETISWYSRPGSYDSGNTASIGTSGLKCVGIKMSSGKFAGVARSGYYSINGAAWTQNYNSNSTDVITPSGRITIGTGYAGAVGSSNAALLGISQCMVWSRELSDTEISQVYQHLQSFHIGL